MKNERNRSPSPDPAPTPAAPRRRLRLARETLRSMSADELSAVAGGRSAGCYRAVPD